jgi:hypothetical protein
MCDMGLFLFGVRAGQPNIFAALIHGQIWNRFLQDSHQSPRPSPQNNLQSAPLRTRYFPELLDSAFAVRYLLPDEYMHAFYEFHGPVSSD